MELFVLRHAIAADAATYDVDADRPLTELGRAKLGRIVTTFDRLFVTPSVVVSSPLLRARQTAEVAAEAIGVPLQIEEALSAGAEPLDVLAALRERYADANALMLVGHEPDLSRLVATLVGGDDGAQIRMKKAGLAMLDVRSLTADGAELRWLMAPKQLLACASVAP